MYVLVGLILPALVAGISQLPLQWGLLLVASLIAGLCLTARWKPAWAEHFISLQTISLVSVAIAAGRTLPSPWWWCLATLFGLMAFMLPPWLAYMLGVPETMDGDDEQYDTKTAHAPLVYPVAPPVRPEATPEGKSIRYINWQSGDRGEPEIGSCLMPDGVYLSELELGCCFSDNGHYFLARSAGKLLILDRARKRLYCGQVRFWSERILRCDEQRIYFQESAIDLNEALDKSIVTDLVAVVDLWVKPGSHTSIQQASIHWPSPASGPRLEGKLYLPPRLSALEVPDEPLILPRYQLYLDDQPSGIAIALAENASLTCINSSESSDTFACRGWPLDRLWRKRGESWKDRSAGYWWWRRKQGWQEIKPTLPEQARLSIFWNISCVEDNRVWLKAELDIPTPSCGWYGESLYSRCGSTVQTQQGHDRFGRNQLAELDAAEFEMAWPPHSGGLTLRSQPLADGRRLQLLARSHDGAQVAYAVTLGNRCIPGLWQLEFRVSDDGKFVALLPACRAKALSEQVYVLELWSGRLFTSPRLLIERLRGFAGGVLEVIELTGLCSPEFKPHPLQLSDLPPPPASRAAKIYVDRGYYRAGHHLRRLRIAPHGLELLPDWRLVDCPQAANADGDFILPAPNRQDAAWLRGAETQYASSWERHNEPRLDGYLLTASRCALFGVTPSLAWSEDGRYLALTHMIPRGARANDDPKHAHQWQLWLLDTQAHSLRIRPGSIGRMPRFESMQNNVWKLRIYEEVRDSPGNLSHLVTIALEKLLQLPEESLVLRERFWHRSEEQQPTAHWQAFDDATLASWRAC